MLCKRLLFSLSLAVGLAALAGCARGQQDTAGAPPPAVHPVTVVTRTVHPARSLSGVVAPLQNVIITSDLTEPAAAVAVNEGDRVSRGQTLARLSTADLDANLAAAERNAAVARAHLDQTRYQATYALQSGSDQVRSAQAVVQQAQANLQLAEANLSRDEQLLSQGYVAVQTVDQQRNQVQVSEQQLAAARAALAEAEQNAQANGTPDRGLQQANIAQAAASYDAARAQAASIAAQIAKADIVSPIDGVVVNRNINPGEYPGTRQIFTLQQIASVYASLNAYGDQVSGIQQGASVAVTTPAVARRTFRGTVVAVLSPTTPASSGFTVKVEVPNHDDALRPGMPVSGNVRQPAITGLAVPVTAFLDDAHQTIMSVADGVAHVVHVNELAEDSHYAIVSGVPPGLQVVSDGSQGLADGQKVAVR